MGPISRTMDKGNKIKRSFQVCLNSLLEMLSPKLGYNLGLPDKFRQKFRVALKEVLMVYRAARVEEDKAKPAHRRVLNRKVLWQEDAAKGLKLYNSAPGTKAAHIIRAVSNTTAIWVGNPLYRTSILPVVIPAQNCALVENLKSTP
jgi:hypothetical protein